MNRESIGKQKGINRQPRSTSTSLSRSLFLVLALPLSLYTSYFHISLYIHTCMYIYIYYDIYYVCIYIYIYIYIYADLFQSSSVQLAHRLTGAILQHHLAGCSPTILQTAFYFAAECRILPTLYHLKGMPLICHSPPQVATDRPDLEPPQPPLAWKSMLPPAQESQIAYFACPGGPSALQMLQKACREQPR